MPLRNEMTRYSPVEVLAIFKEEHRLCSPLDPEADPFIKLTRETTIGEWSSARDLLPWPKVAEFLNCEFKITASWEEWQAVMTPGRKKTLGGLCDFLASRAEKEVVMPVKRLGKACLSAAVFLTLKRNLHAKGVDVSDLRPSTPVELFLVPT